MNIEEIKRIAHMARIQISDNEIEKYRDINDILNMVEQITSVDTSQIEPMSHPLNLKQRLREDEVTEINARNKLQRLASDAEAGVYLVPEVFE